MRAGITRHNEGVIFAMQLDTKQHARGLWAFLLLCLIIGLALNAGNIMVFLAQFI